MAKVAWTFISKYNAGYMKSNMAELASIETSDYQVPKFIRHRTVDGRVVILDLRVGQYLVFDEIASTMWNTLLSFTNSAKRVEHLAKHFNISHLLCERDLNEFVESCKKRGLICLNYDEGLLNTKALNKMGYNPPNIFSAWKCLFVTRRTLARSGFSATYTMHTQMRQADISNNQNVANLLFKATKVFRQAENFFSTRNAGIDCLPRSLALHRFLLSVGLNANHCIGVRCYPFRAHAWVEIEGEIICDTETFVCNFNEIARI